MSIPGSASPLFFTAAADAAAAGPIKSVRFNRSDSAYLSRTPSSTGNRRTFTFSAWLKRSESTSGDQYFFGAYASKFETFRFQPGTDKLQFLLDGGNTANLITDAKFVDFSAWFHVVLAVDTTQATSTDRVKIYVNGVQITSFSTETYPTQNYDSDYNNSGASQQIGATLASGFYHGYMADLYLIDGQQLDPTSFGAFDDNGVWQAAAYSGGSFGTNGFHLFDFANESGIGDDSSGNDNDFTANNLTSEGGSQVRTTELSVNHASGVISQPGNAFNPTYIDDYINTSTFAVTNTAWLGSYANGYAEARWIPVGGYAVSSSLRVYFGVYSNAAASSTLTVTYTDTTTESSSQFTSGTNNWMTLFTASNAAGKTIQKIEISNPSTTNVQFGGFVIDDEIVETANTDTDVLRDVPTNGDSSDDTGAGGELSSNYCTWNPLNSQLNFASLANGNLQHTGSSSGSYFSFSAGTIGFDSSTSTGFYFEVTQLTYGDSSSIGLHDTAYSVAGLDYGSWIGSSGNPNGISYVTSGTVYNFGSTISSQGTYTSNGDVIGVAVKDNKIWFSKNGTYISGNPSTGTSPTATLSSARVLTPIINGFTSGVYVLNAGQRAFNTAAPTGFKALCTTNLPTPTIADGSTAFDAKLWTGNGSSQSITGYSFSPDLVWIKKRSGTSDQALFDTVRGNTKRLYPNDSSGEDTLTNNLTSFDSTGYGLGSANDVNQSSQTYVGWAWDAGSSTASNTDGDVTSSVRANQTAGSSIVKWTAPTWNGGPQSVGHGLNAAPSFIVAKVIDDSASWYCYHKSLDASNPQDKYIVLNSTGAVGTLADSWGTSAPSSTTFGDRQLGWSGGNDVIAYCFAPVEGYSAFGEYAANGNADGPFIHTGFAVSWLMTKRSDGTGRWEIHDYKRPGYNPQDDYLRADSSAAESSADCDFLSNGFKIRNTLSGQNASGGNFIYAAFASNPFSSNGGLAR